LIRVERDPAFWRWVTDHPAVREGALLDPDAVLDTLIVNPTVIPLASEHGGFLFIQRDGIGRVFELHSLFRPEGWGRNVIRAGRAAMIEMFSRGMDTVFTYSVEGSPRSRPPASAGFIEAGPFQYAALVDRRLKTWVLTRQAWENSPAVKGA
jgi:hypothetical protein